MYDLAKSRKDWDSLAKALYQRVSKRRDTPYERLPETLRDFYRAKAQDFAISYPKIAKKQYVPSFQGYTNSTGVGQDDHLYKGHKLEMIQRIYPI